MECYIAKSLYNFLVVGATRQHFLPWDVKSVGDTPESWPEHLNLSDSDDVRPAQPIELPADKRGKLDSIPLDGGPNFWETITVEDEKGNRFIIPGCRKRPKPGDSHT